MSFVLHLEAQGNDLNGLQKKTNTPPSGIFKTKI